MAHQCYWNRRESEFEHFETAFFVAKSIKTPERIILGSALDSGARKSDRLYLEPGLLDRGGCYLFFDSYQSPNESELLALYVGRTNKLANRLSVHWSNTENFISEYQDSIARWDEEFVRIEPRLLSADEQTAFPTGLTWVAFWYEDDERERMYLEHELIFKCRPWYNRT